VYENVRNLPDEIKFFLKNEELRKNIAENGYTRSQNDHKASGYLGNLINKVLNN